MGKYLVPASPLVAVGRIRPAPFPLSAQDFAAWSRTSPALELAVIPPRFQGIRQNEFNPLVSRGKASTRDRDRCIGYTRRSAPSWLIVIWGRAVNRKL